MYEEVKIAKVLRFIGWGVMLVSIILGFSLANVPKFSGTDATKFVWSTALLYWIGGIITGISFLGFAKIISLLDKMNDKLDRLEELDSLSKTQRVSQ